MRLIIKNNQYWTDSEEIVCYNCLKQFNPKQHDHFHYCEGIKKVVCDDCMKYGHGCIDRDVISHPQLRWMKVLPEVNKKRVDVELNSWESENEIEA